MMIIISALYAGENCPQKDTVHSIVHGCVVNDSTDSSLYTASRALSQVGCRSVLAMHVYSEDEERRAEVDAAAELMMMMWMKMASVSGVAD